MEWVFFPLDEKLGLLGGSLCPSLQRKLVRLSSHLPFEVAVALLEDFCGVAVSRETARRLCEAAGADYVEYQTSQVVQIERELPTCGERLAHAQLSVDGAMVPLVGGEWAEVKTLAIGAVSVSLNDKGEVTTHCSNLSYFSRLAAAESFGHKALVETHRRGLSDSPKISAVMDGAEWLQGFIDLHCPKATRILDFPHAAQRVAAIAEAVWGAGNLQTRSWLAEKLDHLKHNGVQALLGELEELQKSHSDLKLMEENLNYLKKRQAQMEYGKFRAQGHAIGSGIVESANKLVVEARLKGAGMHWERTNVNSILSLRNAECNGRWEEAWGQISKIKQQAKLTKREKRRLLQIVACQEGGVSEKKVRTAAVAVPKVPKEQVAKVVSAIGPKKPAADHPWRKAKIGRAKFQLAKAG